jgi:hypothetical protein
MLLKSCMAPGKRVELVIAIAGGGFVAEELANPEFPDNVGKIRCIGGTIKEGESPWSAARRVVQKKYGLFIMPADGTDALIAVGGKDGTVIRIVYDRSFKYAWANMIGRVSTTGHETMVAVKKPPKPWKK